MDSTPTPFGQDPPPDPRRGAAPVIARTPLPMIEVEGPTHRVCQVNDAFCSLVRRNRADLLGIPFAEVVVNGESCVSLLDRVYQTGECEAQVEPDGLELDNTHWLYAMWPTLDLGGQPVGAVIQLTRSTLFRENVIAMNEALLVAGLRQHELREAAEVTNAQLQIEIAERAEVEAALRDAKARLREQAESLENKVAERTAQLRTSVAELEAFAYSLAHDLRAPVRAIRGFTQLALEIPGSEVGPTAAEFLHRVVKAAVRMDSLIQDVLGLSEIILKPIKMASVDVDALVKTLVQERTDFASGRAEIKVDSPLFPMHGNEASLSQCVSNLMSNALKFVKPGARPYVHIWTDEVAPWIQEPSASSDQTEPDTPIIRLWIEDHGIGIANDQYERIFQIFQRLHGSSNYEGTGIGLAIVRKAIDRMGGAVGVLSEVGEGSRFWLELPKG